MVERMADDVERTVAVLLDDLDGRDVVDLVEQYAVPLPLSVISQMLGVSDADRDQFHMWMQRFSEGAVAGPIQLIRALPNGQRMMRLFERLAEQRRAQPDDRLISALVRANEEGDHLNDQEVLAMIYLLLLAGHDTIANLIGSATLALLDHPEQLMRLRENPELNRHRRRGTPPLHHSGAVRRGPDHLGGCRGRRRDHPEGKQRARDDHLCQS
jgi:cytochrome P450